MAQDKEGTCMCCGCEPCCREPYLNKKDIESKIKKMVELKYDLDNHVNDVFNKYIKLMKINFNYMKGWNPDEDEISFYGKDGCMGCYDEMSLDIPIKFFIDPDKEFEEIVRNRELEIKKKKEKERRLKENRRKQKENRDLKEFERLKKKFNDSIIID